MSSESREGIGSPGVGVTGCESPTLMPETKLWSSAGAVCAFNYQTGFPTPALFLRQGISLAQGSLMRLDWLASGLQGASYLCLFSTGITSEPPQPANYYFFFYLRFWGLNSGLHACVASASLSALSLQPRVSLQRCLNSFILSLHILPLFVFVIFKSFQIYVV